MALTNHWPLQDNAATTALDDIVGSGDATLSTGNSSDYSQADGPGTAYPRSILLTNATHRATMTATRNSSTSTFCAWVKFPVSAAGGLKGLVAGINIYILTSGTSSTAGVFDSSAFRTSGYNLTTPGSGWHHLACVSNGTSHRWYVDGVAVGSAITPYTLGTSLTSILGDGFSQGWRSQTADLRLYDTDESANLATIMAEKDSSSGPPRLLMTTHAYMAGQR